MADHDRLCRAFGLEVVTVSSSGMPDIEDDEEFQRSFQEVSLVLGDTLEKGAGSLRITSRCRRHAVIRSKAQRLCCLPQLAK